jgi:thiol-disulfide isomerase/thioredoxin
VPFWKSVVPHDQEIRRGERKFAIGDRSFNGYEHNKVWRGNGDGTFAEVGWATGGDILVDSRACAAADFDRDGRMDLVVRTMYDRSFFLRNEGESGRFLHVRLVGTRSNRMGVGARVTARAGEERWIAEMTCGSGYLSQSEPAVHFGLGRKERVDRLEVRWPSGTAQEFRDVPADRFLTITEGSPELKAEPARPAAPSPRGSAAEDPVVALLRRGKFTALDGSAARAQDFLKDLTLLHVWAPSCKGCEKEAATLEGLSKEVAVLAVAVESKLDEVRAFLDRRKVTYPVLVADEETGRALASVPQGLRGMVRRQFGGWFELGSGDERGIPWSGLVDRSGLQRLYRGPVKRFEAMLDILSSRPDGGAGK